MRDAAVWVLPHLYQLMMIQSGDTPVRALLRPQPYPLRQPEFQAEFSLTCLHILPRAPPCFLLLPSYQPMYRAKFLNARSGPSPTMWVLSMTVVTATKVDVSGVCSGHVSHTSLGPPCNSEGGTEPSVASVHRRTTSLRQQCLSRKPCCTRWPRLVPSAISPLIFRHTLPSICTP